jgi:hypothetical protein
LFVNVSSVGLSSIVLEEATAARAASSLVQAAVASPGWTDIARDTVNLDQDTTGIAVGAKVVEVGEQLTKTLLDIFA